MKKYIFFKDKRSKCKIFLLFMFIALLIFTFPIYIIGETEDLQDDINTLETNVFAQLNDLDFTDIENLIDELELELGDSKDYSFRQIVEKIVNGEFFSDYSDFFTLLISSVKGKILEYVPLIFMLIALSLLGRFVNSLKSKENDGIDNVISFVIYGLCVTILSVSFKNISGDISLAIENIKSQIDAIIPIMLTLMTAIGGVSSVGIYKPLVAILSFGVVSIVKSFLYPLFILSFILVVVGNITNSVKLNKFVELIFSIFKWSIGLIFTLFSAFLTLNGISAGKYDGISVRATKFAMKSYIPIIGGYLSDGLDFMLVASILIKNAIGVGGFILLLFTILTPIINIIILKFSLQFVSAILETIEDSKMSNFINGCSKVLMIPLLVLISISFMYLLVIMLMMITANIV